MNLLIDSGNTVLKIAETGVDDFNVIYNKSFDAQVVSDLLRLKAACQTVYLSHVSTNDSLTQLIAIIKDVLPNAHLDIVVTEKCKFGLVNGYADHTQLGVDRWLAMLAVDREKSVSYCIVDAGTAVTVDWLQGNGVHLGGMIVPGIATMLLGLSMNTRLQQTELSNIKYPANNTDDGISTGIILSVVGAIKTALKRMEQQATYPVQIILTGGNAELVSENLGRESTIIPDLVLVGLYKRSVMLNGLVGKNR